MDARVFLNKGFSDHMTQNNLEPFLGGAHQKQKHTMRNRLLELFQAEY